MSNSLQLLAVYGNDGESSDDDVPGPRVSTKRSFKEEVFSRLPVPESLKKVKKDEWIDKPSEHQGRVRSFQHERGNWATFVYIHCDSQKGLHYLMESVMNSIPDIPLKKVEDFHLSLTKTVILKYHWIFPFVNCVKNNITHYRSFIALFGDLKVYCNEEHTRTFIGLEIKSGFDTLHSLVMDLDKSLSEFQLPQFYEDPSFHMSILWCLGDVKTKLIESLPRLNLLLQQIMAEYHEENWYIPVNCLYCKSGNKIFQFPLG